MSIDSTTHLQQKSLRVTLGQAAGRASEYIQLDYADGGLNIPLQALEQPPEHEQWHAASPLQHNDYEGINYAFNSELCFASMHVSEQPTGAADMADIAYMRLHALGQHLGFGHMLRVWHYLHTLNDGAGDQERYKQFCLGRARALERCGVPEARLPAATLVGSRAPGVRMHFILVKQPPLNLENPRQTSAYHYPREYGPRQPAFARASIMPWAEAAPQLFLSGTASIVGHSSRHVADLPGQLHESLRNIEALLVSAAPSMGALQWQDLDFLKVYLRHRADAKIARQHLETIVGKNLPLIFLHADLCRSELLVELETQVTAKNQ